MTAETLVNTGLLLKLVAKVGNIIEIVETFSHHRSTNALARSGGKESLVVAGHCLCLAIGHGCEAVGLHGHSKSNMEGAAEPLLSIAIIACA